MRGHQSDLDILSQCHDVSRHATAVPGILKTLLAKNTTLYKRLFQPSQFHFISPATENEYQRCSWSVNLSMKYDEEKLFCVAFFAMFACMNYQKLPVWNLTNHCWKQFDLFFFSGVFTPMAFFPHFWSLLTLV